MDKKKQDQKGQAPIGETFITTEMGSARFVSADGEGSTYKYETGPTKLEQGFKGPPWGKEPSMHFVCDEVGIDYDKFVDSLNSNMSDAEMAREFSVDEQAIESLRKRFYSIEAINGNYGQD